jgi:regulatory protein
VTLLSRRDFCSGELRHTLVAQGFELPTVQGVIEAFIERGYINDERYAESYVNLHAERGHGPVRIERELVQRGVDAAVIAAALAGAEDWTQRARELLIRRFGLGEPTRLSEKARQVRFLLYRGFTNDHIRAALGSEAAADLDEP